MKELQTCINERLGNLEVWDDCCWLNSLLELLAFLYLQGYAFIFSCIILLEERLGYSGMFFRLIPYICRGIIYYFLYLELANNLADGTAGVDIYGIHLLLEENLAVLILLFPRKDFLNKLWLNR